MQKYDLAVVKIENIVDPTVALRLVDTQAEKYLGLVDSIKLEGMLNPIAVRAIERPDGDNNPDPLYSVVDGFHRFTAAKELGLSEIPCNIRSIEDAQLLAAQIMANIHKVETKPVEYSRALLQILHNEPMLTKPELASRLCKSPAWINERLGLLKLTDSVAALVDSEEIGLSNAYSLARLPDDEQADYVDRAMTQSPQQFQPIVNARLKALRDARLAGKKAKPTEFEPIPLLRSKGDMVAELATQAIAPALCAKDGATDAVSGFVLGIKWALQLDSVSADMQKEKDKQRKAERAAAKESGDLDRKRKQAKDAARKAEKLRLELAAQEVEESKKQVAIDSAVAEPSISEG